MSSEKEQNKIIDEFVKERNKNKGKVIIPQKKEIPPQMDCWYGAVMNEYCTTDVIRHYCYGTGDWQNPLWHDEEYAKHKTRWGGIIAPPTIMDSIVQPYTGPMLTDEQLEVDSPFDSYFSLPNGSTRWMYQVVRPGDKFHVIQIDMGLTEVKPTRPKPARQFDDVMRRMIYNQREELVSIHDRHMDVTINHDLKGAPFWLAPGEKDKRVFRRITDEERDAILEGYDHIKIRGEDRLYWEDVKVGEEVWPLTVGPLSAYDCISAYGNIVQSHGMSFDAEWQRIRRAFHFHALNEETNGWECAGTSHAIPYSKHTLIFSGGAPVAFYFQMEGLLGRMITNWMGDDAFLTMLEVRMPIIPIVGEVIGCRGKVVDKRVENGEHLVDLDIHIENQDKVVLMPGKATVRLITYEDFTDVNRINRKLV